MLHTATERLGSSPDEERIAELAMLQQYLEEALAALEAVTKTMTAPADRLRRLLTAQDKAAMLYEMAGAGMGAGLMSTHLHTCPQVTTRLTSR